MEITRVSGQPITAMLSLLQAAVLAFYATSYLLPMTHRQTIGSRITDQFKNVQRKALFFCQCCSLSSRDCRKTKTPCKPSLSKAKHDHSYSLTCVHVYLSFIKYRFSLCYCIIISISTTSNVVTHRPAQQCFLSSKKKKKHKKLCIKSVCQT